MEFDGEVVKVTETSKLCKVTRAVMWRWKKSGFFTAGITAVCHYRIFRETLHKLIKSKEMTCCSGAEINKHKAFIVANDTSVRKLLIRSEEM